MMRVKEMSESVLWSGRVNSACTCGGLLSTTTTSTVPEELLSKAPCCSL